MSKQKCEICSQMIPQQEMSKSYKHRCKACVARLTRIDRKAAKQRADLIAQQLEGTGMQLAPSCNSKRDKRLSIATKILQAILSNSALTDCYTCDGELDGAVHDSVALADALINKIDEEGGDK